MALRPKFDLLKSEAAPGAAVAAAAVIGFALANSPWAHRYFELTQASYAIQLGAFSETLSREAWIRQGLMAVFFFLVGLELKHEALRGELSGPRRLALPVIAALGGMVGPAVAYLMLNPGGEGAAHGWPVATAGDTAIALAVLAVVGRGLPQSLRVFLQAMLIAGQLGVTALIAVLYTGEIHMWPLAGAGLSLMGLVALSEWKDAPFLLRAVGYFTFWAFTLKAGVSTALAGTLAALTVPGTGRRPGHEAVLRHYRRTLKPYVEFAVLPLFALTAAGVRIASLAPGERLTPVMLGLLAALAVGKPVGAVAAAWIAVRTGLARRPTGASWLELWGACTLAGTGLAMGLFLAGLAFAAGSLDRADATLGVMAGALVAAGAGGGVLAMAATRRRRLRPDLDEAA